MEYLKILGKSFLYILAITLSLTVIITLLNYISFLNAKVMTFMKIMIPIISMFVGGFIIGKQAKNKGWLEGLKLGLIVIFILFLLSLIIFKQKIDLRNIVFYLILLASTIFGSMIGINKKLENESN